MVWSYPDLRGDVILTADGNGARVGERFRYDPFGQSVDPATGLIGTTGADQALPDDLPGGADRGMVGGHNKLTEHHGTIIAVQMLKKFVQMASTRSERFGRDRLRRQQPPQRCDPQRMLALQQRKLRHEQAI